MSSVTLGSAPSRCIKAYHGFHADSLCYPWQPIKGRLLILGVVQENSRTCFLMTLLTEPVSSTGPCCASLVEDPPMYPISRLATLLHLRTQ